MLSIFSFVQLVTGVTLLEITSTEFRINFTTSLAKILYLPSSAVVISDIYPIETRRQLNISMDNADNGDTQDGRALIKGFLVTYTVIQANTTIAELSHALHASVSPLETKLNNDGYITALLGLPQVRYSFLPTMLPTSYPTIILQNRPSSPFVITIILLAIILAIMAVIGFSFWKSKIVQRGSILAKLSLSCCLRTASRSSTKPLNGRFD